LILSERFSDALTYANELHREQWRKGSQIPYVSHLLAVTGLVLEHGANEDEAVAAVLHDAVEDCGGREQLERIRQRFGDRVAAIVDGCSDSLALNPRDKEDWHDRKERYHARLREMEDSSVLLVSAADKLHNARATLADVRRLGAGVWERFSGGREGSLRNYARLLDVYRGSQDLRVQQLLLELEPVIKNLSELQ
jgi:(p)ppGpp synthase/HD superfamily hydrolase